jgi:hypothetical protein
VNAVVPIRSNIDAVKEAISDRITRNLKVATGSSFDSLHAHWHVSQGLEELKSHLPRRTFGDYVEKHFGLKKQWRCRLMKLGKEWPHVLTAIEWAKAKGEITRSEFSVDGALALVAKWRRDECGYASAATSSSSAGRNRRSRSPGGTDNSIDLLPLLILSLAALKQARAHILFLEAEIERLNRSGVANPLVSDLRERFDDDADDNKELPRLAS